MLTNDPARKKLPYYPMFADDFNGSDRVFGMSLAEVGLYALALNASWTSGSLPDDPQKVALLVRKPAKDVLKAWPIVSSAFVRGDDGRLRNPRQETERQKILNPTSTERVKRFRERLRNGHETRNGTELKRFLEPETKLRAYGSGSGYGFDSEKSEDEILKKYEELVEAWPGDRRQVDLGAQIWISLVDAEEITIANVAEVFDGLERWKNSEQWQKEKGKYVPSIAKWLQMRAWKDWPKRAAEKEIW